LKNDELLEHNYGLNLSLLKQNGNEWSRLRTILLRNAKEMEQCVMNGVAPPFGYPFVLYEAANGP
jgi:hypothetical protein